MQWTLSGRFVLGHKWSYIHRPRHICILGTGNQLRGGGLGYKTGGVQVKFFLVKKVGAKKKFKPCWNGGTTYNLAQRA